MDSLKKYNFKDDHGHPLENCQDYIDLIHRASSAESGLAAMRQRAERAEYCLRHIQRLADDGVDDPAGPHKVLAHIANTVEAALSSPPADAGKMVGERERRLAETLRHVCKHLCQWKDACETGCIVSAALAEMEQKA